MLEHSKSVIAGHPTCRRRTRLEGKSLSRLSPPSPLWKNKRLTRDSLGHSWGPGDGSTVPTIRPVTVSAVIGDGWTLPKHQNVTDNPLTLLGFDGGDGFVPGRRGSGAMIMLRRAPPAPRRRPRCRS